MQALSLAQVLALPASDALAHVRAVLGRPALAPHKRERWTQALKGLEEGYTPDSRACFAYANALAQAGQLQPNTAKAAPSPAPQPAPKPTPKADVPKREPLVKGGLTLLSVDARMRAIEGDVAQTKADVAHILNILTKYAK